ncbi:MAG TPA: beta-galactosidase trimerization domain-containing protein, partial [Terriglobales bacterium]|nr:beta-galactosidase trimerization domain-containing protein [Terriglobales bacterium]
NPVPLFSEVAQIGKEFEKAGPALAKTSVRSEVAILHTYDSRWAIQWQKHNKNYDPVEEIVSYYEPIRAIAQSIDIVPPTAPLSQYKLVVAPGLNVLSDAASKNLMDYVQNGGHLVLGQRSAMKDDDNALQTQRQPGPLGALLGGRVEQYYALTDKVPVSGDWGTGESQLWAELLSARDPDTQVLLRYGKSNGWLDDQPAAITRKVGRGRITYIGAWLDPKTMQKAAEWMTSTSGVKPALGAVPEGVEVSPRYGQQGAVFILINFSKQPQNITLPHTMTDVLEGGEKQSLTLPVYGVAVVASKQK